MSISNFNSSIRTSGSNVNDGSDCNAINPLRSKATAYLRLLPATTNLGSSSSNIENVNPLYSTPSTGPKPLPSKPAPDVSNKSLASCGVIFGSSSILPNGSNLERSYWIVALNLLNVPNAICNNMFKDITIGAYLAIVLVVLIPIGDIWYGVYGIAVSTDIVKDNIVKVVLIDLIVLLNLLTWSSADFKDTNAASLAIFAFS